ncbi:MULTISPECIES: pyridoxamine 5'-phosphate oxidase [unclassified Luteococcus]|uniref:pyridoxamine 5'-phosphate oxidase n=1 Tax=unclassified Luteococcus TaxID=2639923 RepID=UPI00313EFC1A
MDIRGMRRDYRGAELDEAASAPNPVRQFEQWFEDARGTDNLDPNAMTLATVGPDGRPSTRIVLLKSFDEDGLVFFTNYASRKGQELAANPLAALQFHWPQLDRVVRIEGAVVKVSAQESDEYFHQRPVDSRIGAWASPQSQVISNRGVLVTNAAKVSAKHGIHPPRPEHWGGYRLTPDVWEFWQGRTSRLHDRLRYTLADGTWHKERLAP